MKALLALVLILLFVAVGLPTGMGEMGDCPMCASPKMIALGICEAVLSLFMADRLAEEFSPAVPPRIIAAASSC